MLVLSRKADQKVYFPNLDITLKILSVKGKVIKLGIDAPESVQIIRPEAYSSQQLQEMKQSPPQSSNGMPQLLHRYRNLMNTIEIGLVLFHEQTKSGCQDDAEQTLQRIFASLYQFDHDLTERIEPATNASESVTSSTNQVMIVEDDENERELLAGLLRMRGYQVETAGNGMEAMETLRLGTKPDLMLLDLNMPEMNGAQTLQQIRNQEELMDMMVFAASGQSPEEMGIPLGAIHGWIPKPLDTERLMQLLHRECTNAVTTI